MPAPGVFHVPSTEQVDAMVGHGDHVGIDGVQRGVAFAVIFEVAGAFGFAVGGDEGIAGGDEIIGGHASDGIPQRWHFGSLMSASDVGSELGGDAEGEVEGGDGGSRDRGEDVVEVVASDRMGGVEDHGVVNRADGRG